jgi:hypothetical protein
MVKNAAKARSQRSTPDEKRAAKRRVLHDEAEASLRRRGHVALPLVRSKQPGTLALDNARIFEIIPFPG